MERLGEVGRDEVAKPVVVLGVVGQEDAEPVADGDPRGDDQERIGEPGILGIRELVEHCHAISIPMTTVFPEPVAILKATRKRPGFDVSLAARRSLAIQASPNLGAASAR